ncbi:phosphatase PAP2 family protein [Saccharopolyspora rosea]|uniref:Phosphatase PAP2 family protein n=1 Tax=Saccharopolyspora rosea TaxID=524884 RepID=A0ABW3FN26_9PSEU|nr:phosphatase PAP2 family protein [Saccharopolyspora rosea]
MLERTGRAELCARVITEVLAPWVIVLLLPLAVAWQATRSLGPALGWGLWVALTSSVLPMVVIVRGARRGRWDGHHVRDREGRLVPFLVLIALSCAGLAVLLVGGAPWPVVALDIAMIASLLVTGAITAKWKISMHTAVAAGAVVILAVSWGPLCWALLLPVAAVGWSRVRLGDHTPAQTTVGAVVGALVGGGLFALLTG